MTATVLPASSGLPSPRSPTLSDAGMILPDDPSIRSLSPNPYIQRPPSPSSLLSSHSNLSSRTVTLTSPPKGRRGHSPQVRSPPLSTRSSASNLRTMSGAAHVSQHHAVHDDALASSPTLRDSESAPVTDNWDADEQRRRSDSSGSIGSEDLEKMKWPGFDSANGFDDSGVDLAEQEEEHDQFPSDVHGDDDTVEHWLEGPGDGDGDSYSSAALSRRAEIILANAKKRLNVMEGNLRGARHSLMVSPSSFNSTKMSSELTHQLTIARERDRKLYSGIGPIPPRQRPYQYSPLSSTSSPGHSRVLSETSVPPAFSPTAIAYANSGKRSSSAMGVAGVTSGAWSPADGHGKGRFPIRESKSHEVIRDPHSNVWAGHEERDHSLRSYSRESKSPPNTLEPLPEDETPSLQRSPSTTVDLRVQMSELKGRISSLKQRAKEDNLRRRSLQSLRTPSPFTAAEIWYAGAEAYKTSPVSADAGVGQKQSSPTRKELYEDGENDAFGNSAKSPKIRHDKRLEESKGSPLTGDNFPNEYPESYYEDAEDILLEHIATSDQDPNLYPRTDDIEDGDYDDGETDFVSVQDDELELGGDSVYEDAVYDMPVTERHEDRVDAFDYEHFFLHSAMGTYSSASRRSSSGSVDSVETTRPLTAILAPQEVDDSIKRISLHQRNASADSVSTMATFATAAEDQSDDEDDQSNIHMDAFSRQILPSQQSNVTLGNGPSHQTTSDRSDSDINMRSVNGTMTAAQLPSRDSSPGGSVADAIRTSKIYSVLVEPPSNARPRLTLSEGDKQLIYSVASSLQETCANLQRPSDNDYEHEALRRRLDAALRVLNGEEMENESF